MRNRGCWQRLKSRIIYGHRKTYLFKLYHRSLCPDSHESSFIDPSAAIHPPPPLRGSPSAIVIFLLFGEYIIFPWHDDTMAKVNPSTRWRPFLHATHAAFFSTRRESPWFWIFLGCLPLSVDQAEQQQQQQWQ